MTVPVYKRLFHLYEQSTGTKKKKTDTKRIFNTIDLK